MQKRPRVALLVESSRAYGRGLLRGIASFARTHGPWDIFHHERGLGDPVPNWLERWKPDGVLARIESRELAERLGRLGRPVVDLRGRFQLPNIPVIETNDRAVTRMAIDHLIERGFQDLAYCGFAELDFSQRRLEFMRQQLAERGRELRVYEEPHSDRSVDTASIEAQGLHQMSRLVKWLDRLPKPIGILACNDIRGRQVLAACRTAQIKVPDEVALVGIDNDEVLCELSEPPLTSVEPDTVRIGYQAAALLQTMIEGTPAGQGTQYVDPVGIVTRRSTDGLAIHDARVADAVRFIREHACDGIHVADVLRHVRLSRSTLERRFSQHVNSSPKAEIIRVRLDRVKQLLVETDYALAQIADIAGFRHPEYMSTLFREKIGQTPGKYREAARAGAPPATRRIRWTQRD